VDLTGGARAIKNALTNGECADYKEDQPEVEQGFENYTLVDTRPVAVELVERIKVALEGYKTLLNAYEPFDSKVEELKVNSILDELK